MLLINNILVTFASHIMATFTIQKKILQSITSKLLKFWWASSHQKKSIYWRKKYLLEQHKAQGGLGLQNLENLNTALMFKQSWRMKTRPELLMSKVFSGKYFSNWFYRSSQGRHPITCSWGGRSVIKSV